jgi:hypothetical protein
MFNVSDEIQKKEKCLYIFFKFTFFSIYQYTVDELLSCMICLSWTCCVNELPFRCFVFRWVVHLGELSFDDLSWTEIGRMHPIHSYMKWHQSQMVIDLIISGNTSRRMGQTRTYGYTRGGIRCLGGVSIPCWLITPVRSTSKPVSQDPVTEQSAVKTRLTRTPGYTSVRIR